MLNPANNPVIWTRHKGVNDHLLYLKIARLIEGELIEIDPKKQPKFTPEGATHDGKKADKLEVWVITTKQQFPNLIEYHKPIDRKESKSNGIITHLRMPDGSSKNIFTSYNDIPQISENNWTPPSAQAPYVARSASTPSNNEGFHIRLKGVNPANNNPIKIADFGQNAGDPSIVVNKQLTPGETATIHYTITIWCQEYVNDGTPPPSILPLDFLFWEDISAHPNLNFSIALTVHTKNPDGSDKTTETKNPIVLQDIPEEDPMGPSR